MKILWVVNQRLDIEHKNIFSGSWLVSLMKEFQSNSDIELYTLFACNSLKSIEIKEIAGVKHYLLPREKSTFKYDKSLEKTYQKIVEEINPDIIHIRGTESSNGLIMMNAVKRRNIIVSTQGLIGKIGEHYTSEVPFFYTLNLTIRDILLQGGIRSLSKKYQKAAWYEKEMLTRAPYVMARTNWDKACVMHLNQEVIIYEDMEFPRKAFFGNSWEYDKCEPQSIFIGNAETPIKGFHFVLKALPLILKVFPNTKIYIAGKDFFKKNGFLSQFKKQTYWLYLNKLIKKYDLKNHITFLGILDEEKMCQAFLKANVFLLPSVIENSPNTLAEAGVLGVPIVASYVAGIPDLVKNNENGFLYAHDEYYIMADRIIKLFKDKELCLKFSRVIKEDARKKHDPLKSTNLVYQAYVDIFNKKNKEALCKS
ncbi:MAG: glycosyltransferase family 4 protein [Bacilli bacterium]|nr:glycosyltransferase family 4 protein [Bacilli bacterium]